MASGWRVTDQKGERSNIVTSDCRRIGDETVGLVEECGCIGEIAEPAEENGKSKSNHKKYDSDLVLAS